VLPSSTTTEQVGGGVYCRVVRTTNVQRQRPPEGVVVRQVVVGNPPGVQPTEACRNGVSSDVLLPRGGVCGTARYPGKWCVGSRQPAWESGNAQRQRCSSASMPSVGKWRTKHRRRHGLYLPSGTVRTVLNTKRDRWGGGVGRPNAETA